MFEYYRGIKDYYRGMFEYYRGIQEQNRDMFEYYRGMKEKINTKKSNLKQICIKSNSKTVKVSLYSLQIKRKKVETLVLRTQRVQR